MRRILLIILLWVTILPGVIFAAEVTTSLDLARAYVFRGYTLNDSMVIQPGIEVALPVTIGIWGNLNTHDYVADTAGQFTEIDLYASYDIPLNMEPFGLSAGYTEYTYPSAGAGSDADREVNVIASADVLFSPTISVYYGLDGALKNSLYAELGSSYSKAVTDEIICGCGALVAYVDPDNGKSGFSHAEFNLSAGYKLVTLGVKYIARLDDKVLPDATFDENDVPISLGYDTEVVVTLGVSKAF